MRIKCWQFSPGFWPTVATVLVLLLFPALGLWQLDRAAQKNVLQDAFERNQTADPIDFYALISPESPQDIYWRKVKLAGMFAKDMNILLDNQVLNGVAGYFVYTLFKVEQQDFWVWVNRGWVATGSSREAVPDIVLEEAIYNISGSIKAPPKTGILLADHVIEPLGAGVYRLQKFVLSDVQKLSTRKILPYIIRLDADSPAGLVRQWRAVGFGKERHKGYAFQWFAMATAVLCIYLLLNIRRVK